MTTTACDNAGGPARAAALDAYAQAEIVGCTRCALHTTRTQVVPGNGSADARLMFVGEAPGYHEDRNGVPFCGAAGALLDELLAGIGLSRPDVFVANVLKCRPPGNRDPHPDEIRQCERHLFQQVRIVQPAMICSLGNFATKLLSGRPDGISRVHGCELPITVGGTDVLLYPIYHPAAALYAPAMKQVLADDIARIPALLAGLGVACAAPAASSQDAASLPPPPPGPPPAPPAAEVATDQQLGLF